MAGELVPGRRARPALLLMAFLPLIALFPHFVSAALAFIAVLAPGTGYPQMLSWKLPLVLFVLSVLIGASAFGFFGARDFVRAMRSILVVKRLNPDSANSHQVTPNEALEPTAPATTTGAAAQR